MSEENTDGIQQRWPVEWAHPDNRKQNGMTITIPEELQAFVSRSVASGRFRSADEAVREGLSLLKDREDKLESLRADLQVGIDQLDADQKAPLNLDAIKQRGQELLAERQDQQ